MNLALTPDGKVRKLKGFRWIEENLWRFESVQVKVTELYPVMVEAHLAPNITLMMPFDTKGQAWLWLHRKTLYGVPLLWFKTELKIGPQQRNAMPVEDNDG